MGPLLSSAEKDAVQNNIFIYCENFLNCKKKKMCILVKSCQCPRSFTYCKKRPICLEHISLTCLKKIS